MSWYDVGVPPNNVVLPNLLLHKKDITGKLVSPFIHVNINLVISKLQIYNNIVNLLHIYIYIPTYICILE